MDPDDDALGMSDVCEDDVCGSIYAMLVTCGQTGEEDVEDGKRN
jgi:hypothetical protein